jgi:hypothetical protein
MSAEQIQRIHDNPRRIGEMAKSQGMKMAKAGANKTLTTHGRRQAVAVASKTAPKGKAPPSFKKG